MSRLEQAEALLVRAEDWLSDMNDPPLCVVDDIRAFLAAAPRSTLGDVLCERLGLQRSITADAQPGDDSAEAEPVVEVPRSLVVELRDYVREVASDVGNDPSVGISNRSDVDLYERLDILLGELMQCPDCPSDGPCNICYDAGRLTPQQYQSRKQPADSAPSAEPSIAELASHRWRIGDMFCRSECSKVRLVYALDDALALVKYIREDGVLDQCNAAILASWVQASGCALGNLFDKLRTIDNIEQQLSDLAAKVEALSKPQVEAVQFEEGERVLAWHDGSWQFAEFRGPALTPPTAGHYYCTRPGRWGDNLPLTHIAKLPPAPDAQAQEGQR